MDYLSYWALAARAEIGIAIPTNELRLAQKALYEARKGYPEYEDIRLCLPHGGKEVWLVKKTVEVIE